MKVSRGHQDHKVYKVRQDMMVLQEDTEIKEIQEDQVHNCKLGIVTITDFKMVTPCRSNCYTIW